MIGKYYNGRFEETFLKFEGRNIIFAISDQQKDYENTKVSIDINDWTDELEVKCLGDLFVVRVTESKSNKSEETIYTIETSSGDVYFYSSDVISKFRDDRSKD